MTITGNIATVTAKQREAGSTHALPDCEGRGEESMENFGFEIQLFILQQSCYIMCRLCLDAQVCSQWRYYF